MAVSLTSRGTRRKSIERRGSRAGYAFVGAYTVMLVLFGLVPVGYALWMSVTNSAGQLVGIGNFTRVVSDYRFGPAFAHIGVFLVEWLVTLMVLVVVLALMLHARLRRASRGIRFLYYLPGAFAGAASVLLWLILLDPVASPVGRLLRAFGWTSANQVMSPGHLPVIFVVIAFWTGAGGWILIMYGALNGIPDEVLEAARIDGANVFQLAWHVQIPMLRRWIAYMLILAFAGGTQLFVEPQLVGAASGGQVSDSWSPNQLSYQFAFAAGDFNGAAAIAVYLLVISLGCAALVVFKARLFNKD
ncbi:carbohydrate ABC transporter permease [Streptomyces sp. NPDC056352]|uniref:carbohydrate ABC transporter permease n=1 Tax=Streptomyces sp. NPDC056352 TaxID=3345791 RepID=UPI0035D688CF